MSCYHPNRIFYTGRKNPTGGKETYYQASYLPKEISLETVSRRIKGMNKITDLDVSLAPNGHYYFTNSEVVPCGKCIGCKLDKSRNWATRLMIEAKDYGNKNAFLTLTYDDEHLPEDGKISIREMQLFWKRLRKHYGKGLRIAYSGELGSITKRPHYHAIVLGIEITDFKPWNMNLKTSETITRIWGKGNVIIGDVTFNSAAYVARYMLKKQGDDDTFFKASRRPGLGYEFIQKNGDVYADGKIYIHTDTGNTLQIPKYYRYLLKREDPYTYEALKGVPNEEAEEIAALEAYAGLGSYERILEYKEEIKIREQKRHKRPL